MVATTVHGLEPFLNWFQSSNGTIDVSSIDFTIFPASDGGRGVIALVDIPEGHTLFTIPRLLTLSTRTSSLPSRFGEEKWKEMRLYEGWIGLILCMMWEMAQGPSSKWFEYLTSLPTKFDTPMFWDENDLMELEGTSVVEKLGRADAEQSYREKLLPAIQSRPDLFYPELVPTHYSLEVYHIMGSLILSRSFNVERWDSEEENLTANTSHGSGMDVDSPEDNSDQVEVEEDDDDDDSSDIAMVPMADLLNARYGSENAKLFYEEHELKMISTKPIKAGEQIWNTYGDLPNSELLRRYGHVDLLPLLQGDTENPGDAVEIRADVIVSVVFQRNPTLSSESSQERIDWWLEEGGDDVFVLEADHKLPSTLISFIRLLLLSDGELEKVKEKSKPPRPKVDNEILNNAHDVVTTRLSAYPTDLKEDAQILSGSISLNKRHAVIVRTGEKRILHGTLNEIRGLQAKESAGQNKRKDGGDEVEIPSSKKSKR